MRKKSYHSLAVCLALLMTVILPSNLAAAKVKKGYFPPRGEWKKVKPSAVKMDAKRLGEAIEYAKSKAWTGHKNLSRAIEKAFSSEPYFSILGPTKERGDACGLIIKNGYIVAEWGDTRRVDMTFSVTKSYLSTVAGLALDAGLIRSVQEPVGTYITDGKFDSEHNRKITWEHLLQQTSDWQGELWDRFDWADRPDRKGTWDNIRKRKLHEPGSHFKYNDVRVNLLAYCLLQVWRRPLPLILREKVMDPIGASSTWRWHGYKNSWVLMDGLKVQSVSGGGHWGGGMFINTRDQARFGLLFLRSGRWGKRQLISRRWIKMVQQPAKANAGYGYMWWLNTEKIANDPASESIYYAAGFGGNYIVVIEKHDLLVVVRWTNDIKGVVTRVLTAIK